MHEVRAVSLTGYTEVARILGLGPVAMFDSVRIDPQLLSDPEARLPADRVVELLERSASQSGCESFGLLMAECRSFASLGPLSLLLEHTGSIREAVQALIDYRRYMNDILEVNLEEEDQAAMLRFDILPHFAGRQAVDMALALGFIVLGGASRRTWRPDELHLTHAAPGDLSIFRRFFPCALVFDSDFNGFSCSRDEIDRPFPWANPLMAQHARQLLESSGARGRTVVVSDGVLRAITLLMPSGRATIEYVAEHLNMGIRQLQRALAKEGRSFADLLSEARREMAERNLANPAQSVTSIAFLLGYSSVSSFSRWFGSEFGMTPNSWRDSLFRTRAA